MRAVLAFDAGVARRVSVCSFSSLILDEAIKTVTVTSEHLKSVLG